MGRARFLLPLLLALVFSAWVPAPAGATPQAPLAARIPLDPSAYGPAPGQPARTPSGPLVITTDHAVVHDLDVTGGIDVRADDVTIRNVSFRIDPSWSAASGPNFVVQGRGHHGLTVVDSRFDGFDTAGRPVVDDAIADVSGQALTMRRNDVTGVCNGIEAGNGTRSWRGTSSTRCGSTRTAAAAPTASSSTAAPTSSSGGNYVRMGVPPVGTWSQTTAIGVWADLGNLRDVTVRDNVVDVGAGFLFYAGVTNGTGFSVTNCSFVDNVVLRDRWHGYGVWYPNDIRCTRSGTAHDDGSPVSRRHVSTRPGRGVGPGRYPRPVSGDRRAEADAAKTLTERLAPRYRTLLGRLAHDVYARVEARTAVVITPHADDETLGCGATIARKRAAGTTVRVVVASDGSGAERPADTDPGGYVELRRHEARQACARLGVSDDDRAFFGLPDGALGANHGLEQGGSASVLGDARPDDVFVPCAIDGHADHRAVAAAITHACSVLPDTTRVLAYPVWFWNRWAWTQPSTTRARQHGRGARRAPLLVRGHPPSVPVATTGFLTAKQAALDDVRVAGRRRERGDRPRSRLARAVLPRRRVFFPVVSRWRVAHRDERLAETEDVLLAEHRAREEVGHLGAAEKLDPQHVVIAPRPPGAPTRAATLLRPGPAAGAGELQPGEQPVRLDGEVAVGLCTQ